RACHFVVVDFDGHPLLFKQQAHLRTHVGKAINGRDRYVSAFMTGSMPQVGAVHVQATRPAALFGVDFDEASGHTVIPTDAVKHEKFWLGTKISCVANAA